MRGMEQHEENGRPSVEAWPALGGSVHGGVPTVVSSPLCLISRWRSLEGTDPSAYEMILKIHALQVWLGIVNRLRVSVRRAAGMCTTASQAALWGKNAGRRRGCMAVCWWDERLVQMPWTDGAEGSHR